MRLFCTATTRAWSVDLMSLFTRHRQTVNLLKFVIPVITHAAPCTSLRIGVLPVTSDAGWTITVTGMRRMGGTRNSSNCSFVSRSGHRPLEKHFCSALGLAFDISVDNLDNPDISGLETFRQAVNEQYLQLSRNGLPSRAAAIAECLALHRSALTI